jgi:hypothetical protein
MILSPIDFATCDQLVDLDDVVARLITLRNEGYTLLEIEGLSYLVARRLNGNLTYVVRTDDLDLQRTTAFSLVL